MSSHKSRKHPVPVVTTLTTDPRSTRRTTNKADTKQAVAEKTKKKAENAVKEETFVCAANRCIMSVLPQPISNRAPSSQHATMRDRDLPVCKHCVERHADECCSVAGCNRVHVFGEQAGDELAFAVHTDKKLYCPSCIQRVYANEGSANAVKIAEDDEEEEEEEEEASSDDASSDYSDLSDDDEQTFVCDATRCDMADVPQSVAERASSKFHSTVFPPRLQVCKNCVERHEHLSCNGDGCPRVDVFGNESIDELRFMMHTDGKKYCPSCIVDKEQEDAEEDEEEEEEEEEEA